MAKAFKKPNLKLIKAIRFIQNQKNLTLESFSTERGYYCFKLTSHSFVMDRDFQEKTFKIFHKDYFHLTNNQITFYLK